MNYFYLFAFIVAAILIVVNLRYFGQGKINLKHLAVGLAVAATLITVFALIGSVHHLQYPLLLVFMVVATIAWLIYKAKPEVFHKRKQTITWVLYGIMIAIFTLGVAGCASRPTQKPAEERFIDKPLELEEGQGPGFDFGASDTKGKEMTK